MIKTKTQKQIEKGVIEDGTQYGCMCMNVYTCTKEDIPSDTLDTSPSP